MVNGTSGATTYLQEGTGQSFALSVETPSTLENYGLTVGELVLAGVLVFFAVVESLSFLRDIYPKAFPYIYEYEEDRAKKKKKKADDKKVSLNPEDRKPEPL
jgi:hypothetical protein